MNLQRSKRIVIWEIVYDSGALTFFTLMAPRPPGKTCGDFKCTHGSVWGPSIDIWKASRPPGKTCEVFVSKAHWFPSKTGKKEKEIKMGLNLNCLPYFSLERHKYKERLLIMNSGENSLLRKISKKIQIQSRTILHQRHCHCRWHILLLNWPSTLCLNIELYLNGTALNIVLSHLNGSGVPAKMSLPSDLGKAKINFLPCAPDLIWYSDLHQFNSSALCFQYIMLADPTFNQRNIS